MPRPNINELGLVLFGTARAWRTKLDQRLRPLGLSQGKWRTLIHLSQGGKEKTIRVEIPYQFVIRVNETHAEPSRAKQIPFAQSKKKA